MSQRERTPLAPGDRPSILNDTSDDSFSKECHLEIVHTEHPEKSDSTKKKRERKTTTTSAQTSRAKRQTRAANAAKLDDQRKGTTKAGRRNQTDPVNRRSVLSEDEWAASVQPYVVKCKGCEKPIKLDVRYGQYYRSNWNKHKKLCKKIKEARKKEAKTTRLKESDDENVRSDMDIDSDSQSMTDPGVTRDDSPHSVRTSMPEMENALTLVTSRLNIMLEKQKRFDVLQILRTRSHHPLSWSKIKLARHTSRAVTMLDQASVELLAANREHLHHQHRQTLLARQMLSEDRRLYDETENRGDLQAWKQGIVVPWDCLG